MHSQTYKRQAEDVRFNNDDINDEYDVKRSRYLYTYNIRSPDLFTNINDSDENESVYSIQSKETIELGNELDSGSETSCGSDFDCQNSSHLDNSELEVTKHSITYLGVHDGYVPDDTDSQITLNLNSSAPSFFKLCLLCKKTNSNALFQYCSSCFIYRKQLSESKPDCKPKRIKLLSTMTNNIDKIDTISSLKNYPESSTSSSQESGSFGISGLCLSQESTSDVFENTGNLCNICCLKAKNGIFNHGKTAHVYCCYSCAKRIWRKNGRCPICNLKIRYVTKAVSVSI